MKIKSLKIKNFRGYCGEITINFDEFTALVGKNDIGKSSIMEALDIFFNDGKGVVKLDKEDVNVCARANQENEIGTSSIYRNDARFYIKQNIEMLIVKVMDK